ncbi:hypothetical protein NQ318_016300 [Aromia moschata]|uniref:Peptidase aspartic putative domain-containing protein n=1 Tax=Aromia moschata TaxID=1265417 RepID=A0AAV8Z5Q9_9CUCU|nr:hypothetical protein NQ318_016300 [Aromia moschata]
MYDSSKRTEEPAQLDYFRIRYETIEESKTAFLEVIDQIQAVEYEINSDYVPCFQSLDAFDELYCHIKIAARRILKNDNSTNMSVNRGIPKLPKLQIPNFSGNIKDWPTYIECFNSLIHHNGNLSDVDRVHYLIGSLSGAALSVCSGVPPTGENYRIIYQTQAQTETATSLNAFLEKFDVAVKSLQKLQISELDDYILAYLALSKLNPETQRLFENAHRKTEMPSYTDIKSSKTPNKTENDIAGVDSIARASGYNSSNIPGDSQEMNPIVDKITSRLPQVEIDFKTLSHLTDVPLADDTFYKPNQIDGIIGAELYPYLIGQGRVTGASEAPVAIETSLGYVVMGSVHMTESPSTSLSFCSIVDPSLDNLVKRFWETEDVSSSSVANPDDVACEAIFEKTFSRDKSGRYTVTLPFQYDPTNLGDSYKMAEPLRTVRQLANDEQSSLGLAAEVVKHHMYMDDLITSSATVDQAIILYKELIELFHRDITEKRCSKRNILSTVARCFDPLGFLSPVTLKAKLLIKQMWILKLDWDESPPDDIVQWWNEFQTSLPLLTNFSIPRHVGAFDNCIASLIGFADACKTSYGAVVYVRIKSPTGVKCSSLYRAMQQQAFYFISRKYVHDVQQK